MTTHSERVAVAIAMRKAITDRIMEGASPEQSDRFRNQGNNWQRDAVREINNVDVLDVLAKNGRLAQKLSDREEFERAARIEKFPVNKMEDGTYQHHITNRLWRMWLAARQTD